MKIRDEAVKENFCGGLIMQIISDLCGSRWKVDKSKSLGFLLKFLNLDERAKANRDEKDFSAAYTCWHIFRCCEEIFLESR